jgi:hypothetical protein
MAVKETMPANRWWEQGLNLQVWSWGGKCPTCGGVLKYRYSRLNQPAWELQIFPNKSRFVLMDGRTVKVQGTLDEMKAKLDVL